MERKESGHKCAKDPETVKGCLRVQGVRWGPYVSILYSSLDFSSDLLCQLLLMTLFQRWGTLGPFPHNTTTFSIMKKVQLWRKGSNVPHLWNMFINNNWNNSKHKVSSSTFPVNWVVISATNFGIHKHSVKRRQMSNRRTDKRNHQVRGI